MTRNGRLAGCLPIALLVSIPAGCSGGGGSSSGGGGNPPDTTGPVIAVNGANPASVDVGTAYVDAGATAWDDRDGDVTDA